MPLEEILHPFVQHRVGYLRDASTSPKEFRLLAAELAMFLAYEACRDLVPERHAVEGWAGNVEISRLDEDRVTLAPVLRAGLGMLEGAHRVLPHASVTFLGFRRNEETLEPEEYYESTSPLLPGSTVLLLDPMLATGGTAVASIEKLKEAGAEEIRGIFLIAAPEGVKAVEAAHPECEVIVAALDERLNDRGFILPGLGDAGDRIFGTEG